MYFKRKVYNELLEWKKTYSDKYAVLLEGARRVGKSTIAENESLIIFDEVQLFPKARQAIKHLVLDGKYSYLETGSLISIKKNVNEKTYSCKQKACGSI